MQQFTPSYKQCSQHPENKVIYVCIHKSCLLNRLACVECAKYHSTHNENLLSQDKFEIKIKEALNNQQLFIFQVDQMIIKIKKQLDKIISALEAKYNMSIEKMNEMENQQLHENLSNIVYFEDEKTFLNSLLERRINSMIELENKFFHKSLKDLQQKEINLLNIEKFENYYQQGKEYFNKYDYKNAIFLCEEALKINQNHIQSLSLKGEALSKIRSDKESIECFDKATSIIELQYKQIQNAKGFSLRIQKKYKESIECFDKILTIDSQNIQGLYGKGDSLRMLEQYKESILWFDKALAIDPKYKEALQGKGDSLRLLEKYKDAIKYFEQALQIDSQYGLSLGSLGASLLELGKLDEAEQCLNQAIELNPYHEFNHHQLCLLFQLIFRIIAKKKKKINE